MNSFQGRKEKGTLNQKSRQPKVDQQLNDVFDFINRMYLRSDCIDDLRGVSYRDIWNCVYPNKLVSYSNHSDEVVKKACQAVEVLYSCPIQDILPDLLENRVNGEWDSRI